MATWMVHLRLAENLAALLDGLVLECLALGSIAPDSGIPDEKWENFDPPSEVTHFAAPQGARYELADLDFYRRYLLPLGENPERNSLSFRLGYFFHLVTDNLWSVEIGQPTQQRFAAQFKADKDFIWEVKKDWYGLDFIYVRENPDCLFRRVFLGCQAIQGGLDFLPIKAVDQRVTYIKDFYQRRDEKVDEYIKRPYVYLSRAEMDRFVDRATRRLHGIYENLFVRQISSDGLTSALSLGEPKV